MTLAHCIFSSPCALCRYAFVLYLTKEGTAEVLTKLNQAELTDFPGRKVTIVKSDVKNKLFIGNLPKTLSRDQIFEAIKAEVVGEWELVGRLCRVLSARWIFFVIKAEVVGEWEPARLVDGYARCCLGIRPLRRSGQRS